MFNKDFKNISQIKEAFPNEQVCTYHLESIRWNKKITSPFDKESKVYNCKGNKYKCKNTGKYFNVKTGTIFDNSKIPLQKWFIAIWLLTIDNPSIEVKDLSSYLNITEKSSHYMIERISSYFNFKSNIND